MPIKRVFSIRILPALALCMCSLPAAASTVLFSDLGTGSTVYLDATEGWAQFGSEYGSGTSLSNAQLFTVAGTGSVAVTQIDLGVSDSVVLNTFYASILTDNAGTPGSEVPGAYWSLSATNPLGTCCGLVSITGISGLDLTGGQSYFMVLGPVSLTDDSATFWNFNSQSVYGLAFYSQNGGSWVSRGSDTELSAFDVLGATSAPEPGSFATLGLALLSLAAFRKSSGDLQNTCRAKRLSVENNALSEEF
jgi:hypothetical protein